MSTEAMIATEDLESERRMLSEVKKDYESADDPFDRGFYAGTMQQMKFRIIHLESELEVLLKHEENEKAAV